MSRDNKAIPKKYTPQFYANIQPNIMEMKINMACDRSKEEINELRLMAMNKKQENIEFDKKIEDRISSQAGAGADVALDLMIWRRAVL